MPLVKVEILKGKNQDYKKLLLDNIHEALVESLKIPADDRIQRLYELDKDHFDVRNSDEFILIEITIFKGRSNDAKKKVYRSIVEKLEKEVGIARANILIVINEQPLENWGIAGGKAASEVDLGFDLDV